MSSCIKIKSSRVLVAPLDWGLGHATRCVPIIERLLAEGHEVVIAADGYPLRFLRREFPHLDWVKFEGLKVEYADGQSQVGAMLRQLPRFLRDIWREHKRLKEIVRMYDIDMVVSDNRFGLWCRGVYSVYMTHQLMVKMPRGLEWMEWAVWRFHRWFINHYDECWVPDIEGGGNLSGDLSHKYPLLENTKFIGVLSRFSSEEVEWEDVRVEAEALGLQQRYDVVAVLSGPEPHRSNLEQEIADNRLQITDDSQQSTVNSQQTLTPSEQSSRPPKTGGQYKIVSGQQILTPSEQSSRLPKIGGQYKIVDSQQSLLIVQGLPEDDLRLAEHRDGVDYIPHLPTRLLQWYMQEAEEIVCRSGYSSIMDLHTIERKAHLIPTPGQTEQIYLAEIHR
ncbi:MAG: glycosyltransferase [Paludibacteraceae bacterium]|nr:glycosyltransferase [Paludibacteraceae bacterium]